jgi:hypothetical protein
VSPDGSDASRCTAARPCATFDRAYRIAEPGQVVYVNAGKYGRQEIGIDRSKTSSRDVRFEPAPGARVDVGGVGVDVFGSHVEFRGMRFSGGWYVHPGAADVTFRDIESKDMFITSAREIRVIGGVIGPGRGEPYDSQIKSIEAGAPPPTDILIDGVSFLNWWRPAGSGYHTECLQIGSGVNVVIRGSRFERCATHDVFIRSWGRGFPLRNFRIENNVFDATLDGYYSLAIGSGVDGVPCESFLIRNNSALQNMRSACTPAGDGVRFVANIQPSMRRDQCDAAGSSWDYNLYGSGYRCGPHDLIGAPRFHDPSALDLRPGAGSPAHDRGHPSNFPPGDVAGAPRPRGGRSDIGAYELG